LLMTIHFLGLSVSLIAWYYILVIFHFINLKTEIHFSYFMAMIASLMIYRGSSSHSVVNSFFGNSIDILNITSRQAIAVSLGLMICLLVSKDEYVSRYFIFSYIPVAFLILGMINYSMPKLIRRFAFSGYNNEKTIIIFWNGITQLGMNRREREMRIHKLGSWIRKQMNYGVDFIGMLAYENRLCKKVGIPFLGEPEDLKSVLEQSEASSLIMMQRPPQREILSYCLDVCENMGVKFSVIDDFDEYYGKPFQHLRVDGVRMFIFRREPLQNPFNRTLKRIIDILFSFFVVVLVLPPVSLLVLIIHSIHSPGPLFFIQDRTGRGNKVFKIIKFRTMHPSNPDETRQASKNDSRVFSGGSFLRRTSLDELPQFVNVLYGDMSIVGPRPHMPKHNELWSKIIKSYPVRAHVCPGITGIAQSRGLRGEATSDLEIAQRVQCDMEYIAKWSLLLDVLIIIKTTKQIFFPVKTAY